MKFIYYLQHIQSSMFVQKSQQSCDHICFVIQLSSIYVTNSFSYIHHSISDHIYEKRRYFYQLGLYITHIKRMISDIYVGMFFTIEQFVFSDKCQITTDMKC